MLKDSSRGVFAGYYFKLTKGHNMLASFLFVTILQLNGYAYDYQSDSTIYMVNDSGWTYEVPKDLTKFCNDNPSHHYILEDYQDVTEMCR